MGEYLSAESKFADGFAVESTLLGGRRACEFNLARQPHPRRRPRVLAKVTHIIDPEVVQRFGYFNLLLRRKECIGKLLAVRPSAPWHRRLHS